MARTAILAIRIVADATKAAQTFAGTSKQTSKWERGLASANAAAKGTIAVLAGLGLAAAKQASDLEQAAGAVESVFGKSAAAVMRSAKGAAQATGLAASEYASFAAVLGAQLDGLGVAADQLAPTTDKLIGIGADLAATFGGTSADAVNALSAALRGETDPIEKYGISIKQADVNARLAAQGQDKLTGEARKQAETQARLAIITEKSAKAQGAFARESDTAAGAQQRAAAEAKNAAAAIGAVLLPVLSKVASLLSQGAQWAQRNATAVQVLAGVVAGLAAAIIAVNAAMTVYRGIQTAMAIATKAAAAAQWLLNIAMTANPIGIIIVAVVALVAGLVLLYKKSATFRAIIQAVGKAGVAAFRAVVAAVKIAWQWLSTRLRAAVNAVARAFRAAGNTAKSAFTAVANFVRRIIATNRALANILRGAVASAFRAVGNTARAVFSSISSAIRRVLGVARSVASGIAATFRHAFDAVRNAGRNAANAIMSPFRSLLSLVNSVIAQIRNIRFPSPPSWLNKAIAGPKTAGTAATNSLSPTRHSPQPGTRTGVRTNGGNVTVNVNGALDPEQVARQISRLLGGASHRRRGVVRQLRAGAAA